MRGGPDMPVCPALPPPADAVLAELRLVQQPHALCVVIIAAGVEAHGPVGVALRDEPCAAQIFDCVFEVRLGVETVAVLPRSAKSKRDAVRDATESALRSAQRAKRGWRRALALLAAVGGGKTALDASGCWGVASRPMLSLLVHAVQRACFPPAIACITRSRCVGTGVLTTTRSMSGELTSASTLS